MLFIWYLRTESVLDLAAIFPCPTAAGTSGVYRPEVAGIRRLEQVQPEEQEPGPFSSPQCLGGSLGIGQEIEGEFVISRFVPNYVQCT
jgi:hypothetical protein